MSETERDVALADATVPFSARRVLMIASSTALCVLRVSELVPYLVNCRG